MLLFAISVGIVNRQSDRWKYRMVGADVEVLDADMSIVASMNVMDEQGKRLSEGSLVLLILPT